MARAQARRARVEPSDSDRTGSRVTGGPRVPHRGGRPFGTRDARDVHRSIAGAERPLNETAAPSARFCAGARQGLQPECPVRAAPGSPQKAKEPP